MRHATLRRTALLLAVLFAGLSAGLTVRPAGAVPLDGVALPSSGVPDAAATFTIGLDGLLADWPGAESLNGSATVRLTAVSTEDGIARTMRLRCDETRIGGLMAGRLEIDIAMPPRGQATLRATLEGPAGRVEADLRLDAALDLAAGRLVWGTGPVQGRVAASAVDLARLTAAWPALALGGTAGLEATIAGAAERPAVRARLSVAGLSWRGEPVGEAVVAWVQQDERAAVDLRLGDEGQPLLAGRFEIPLAIDLRRADLCWLDDRPHALTLVAHRLTPDRLRPLWRAPAGADFLLDLDLTGEGPLDRLALAGTLAGSLGASGSEPVPVDGRLTVGPDRQDLALTIGGSKIELALETAIPLVAVRRQRAPLAPAAIAGSLRLAVPLPLLAPYLPDGIEDPVGTLAGRVELAGTLGAPAFSGSLGTENARATLLPLQRRLEQLSLAATFDGDRLTVDRIEASSGPGRLTAQGLVRLQATAPDTQADARLWSGWSIDGSLNARLDGFPLVHNDLPVSLVDTVMVVEVSAGPGESAWRAAFDGGEVRLTGEQVPRTRAVPSNPAVEILDFLQRPAGDGGVLDGGGHRSLQVEIVRPVRVVGDGIELAIVGRMAVDRLGDVVSVDGGIDLQPGGRFRLFDNPFEIRSGRLALAEGHLARPPDPCEQPGTPGCPERDPDAPAVARPLEPVLDITSRGLVSNTHVLAKVRGPGRRPELLFVSVPGLPEYQILTLLILGRIDVVDDRNGEVRKAAASIVNRFNNPGLKRQLFDKLGVDKVGFGFGSKVSQPVVTVGKQVTRTLFVETTYRHNAPPDQNGREGHVQYSFDPHWSTDTVFGDAGEGRLGVFWSTRFGGPPPPEAPPDDWGVTAVRERGDADNDGIEDPFDLCVAEAEDTDGFEDTDGCPDTDNDQDGLADGVDRAPDEAERYNGFEDEDGVPDRPPHQVRAFSASIRGFPFPTGGAVLPREGREVLGAAASLLKGLPWLRIEITGHADDQGTPAANQRVSLSRALVARAALVAAGVSGDAVVVYGLGSDHPLVPASDDDARARNRRVEMSVSGEAGR